MLTKCALCLNKSLFPKWLQDDMIIAERERVSWEHIKVLNH